MKKPIRLFITVLAIAAMLLSCLTSCGGTMDPQTVKVELSDAENGTISSTAKGEVAVGTSVTVTVTPNSGYSISTFTINGFGSLEELVDNKYTFVAEKDVTFAATFEAIPTPTPTVEMHTVTGILKTEDGTYTGAKVVLTSETTSKNYRATLGADGRYTVEVPAGTYSVSATHTNFDEEKVTGIAVAEDRELNEITMLHYTVGNSPVGSNILAGGTFNKLNGKYITTNAGTLDKTFFKGLSGTQYIMQVDLRCLGTEGTGNDTVMGLVIGQNATQATGLYFRRNTNTYGLATNSATLAGKWQYPEEYKYTITDGIVFEKDLTVTVVRDEEALTVYFDGVEMISLPNYFSSDATAVGLYSNYAFSSFDNIVLTKTMTKLNDMLETAATPDAATSREVEVILIAGQSNAVGQTSKLKLEERFPDIYEKYKNGFENIYISYCNNYGSQYGYNESCGFVNVMFGQGFNHNYFGPEIGIAAYYAETYPDREVYIIKCAYGATDLAHKWNPNDNNNTCYQKFVEYTDAALALLTSQGLTPKVTAFCWVQGENDATQSAMCARYEENTINLISAVRSHFDSYAKYDDIIFVDATIREPDETEVDAMVALQWKDINDSKKKVFNMGNRYNLLVNIQNLDLISSQEQMSEANDGNAHYDSESMVKLGREFASTLDTLMKWLDR